MPFTLYPLGPGAAEIIDVNCAQAIDNDFFAALYKSFLAHPVLVFRNQSLTAPQFAAFCRRFGPLENYATPANMKSRVASLPQTAARQTPDQKLYQHPDAPEVLVMTNRTMQDAVPIAVIDDAENWHSDGSHKLNPYKAVAVHVVKNPASGGGETEFCDLRAVYDALPGEVQLMLNGRTALHHWSKSLNPRYAHLLDAEARAQGESIAKTIPVQPQPLIRLHPETSRPFIYVSPRFTVGVADLDEATSEKMLGNLFGLMNDPAFVYRHAWKDGDMMVWDNRCLNHRVRGYNAAEERSRYRITIAGDAAF